MIELRSGGFKWLTGYVTSPIETYVSPSTVSFSLPPLFLIPAMWMDDLLEFVKRVVSEVTCIEYRSGGRGQPIPAQGL